MGNEIGCKENIEKKGTDEALLNNGNTPEDELLNILNQFDPNDPDAIDIQSITDLLGGIEEGLHEDDDESYSKSSNISVEVQDKTEKVKKQDNGTQDNEIQDNGIQDDGIQYINEDNEAKESSEKLKSKGKKSKRKEKSKEKKGLFRRMFGKANDEKPSSEKDADSDPQEGLDKEEVHKEKKKKKKDKKDNKDKKDKENKAAGKEKNEFEDPLTDDRERPDEKKKSKKAKKEKKKKEKAEIIEEEIDEGRIHPAGAAIVFLLFGTLAVILLVTTKKFSYSQNIRNASKYFDRKEYSQAYNAIAGLDLQDEDVELYNKIETVMFVNKELESFYNYYNIRKYPEALDSLLKGLKRYEKYTELATMLGIKEDMDYVRNQIIEELYQVFSLTEEEAMEIISTENRTDYSKAVYEAVHSIITYY